MTQVISAIDLIRRSMYLINAVASGEIPSDSDLNDALLTLNEMIDGWNIQNLAVFHSATETWNTIPGQAVYYWGPTADAVLGFTSNRPIQIDDITCTRNGFTTAVLQINQKEYDNISLKSTSQPLVERVLYVNEFPLGIITMFPVPSEQVQMTFAVNRQIVGPVTLQTQIALPPGYLRALRYNLAVDLWPEYTNSTTDIASVKAIAKTSLGNIKTANMEQPVSTFESIPSVESGRSWDWRSSV